jgi:hypothetical protein
MEGGLKTDKLTVAILEWYCWSVDEWQGCGGAAAIVDCGRAMSGKNRTAIELKEAVVRK